MVSKQQAVPEEAAKKGKPPPKTNIVASSSYNNTSCFNKSNLLCICFRNLIVNLGLFAAGVWVARNLTDIDLMAPQPVA
uniref:Mitochondrial import receptor subunit TOM6 homolog n=1 Tax=Chelydra serpentina TaxID=8475 RepID=A0A8C3SGJ6_CHESE